MASLEVGKKYKFKDNTHSGYVHITSMSVYSNKFTGNWHYNTTEEDYVIFTDYWNYHGSADGVMGFDLDEEYSALGWLDYTTHKEPEEDSSIEPTCFCPIEMIMNEFEPKHYDHCKYYIWKKKQDKKRKGPIE